MKRLRPAREAATWASLPGPISSKDMFFTISVAVLDSWQRRWEAIGATTKIGIMTRTAVRPWTYTHIHERRS